MILSAEGPAVRSRRPACFLTSPQIRFDCRTSAGPPPSLKSLLDTADRLSPGHTLVLRTDFEPELLCRILANHGFNCWLEQEAAGGWRVFFLKVNRS